MYPNLKAEMARRDITITQLAIALGVTVSTMSLKLSGKYPITLDEARNIKDFIGTDIPIEILFQVKEVS